jgi:hypothetical protein
MMLAQRANFRNRAVVERGSGHYRSIVTVTPVTRKSQSCPGISRGFSLWRAKLFCLLRLPLALDGLRELLVLFRHCASGGTAIPSLAL